MYSGNLKPIYPGRIRRVGGDIDWEKLRRDNDMRTTDGSLTPPVGASRSQTGNAESSHDRASPSRLSSTKFGALGPNAFVESGADINVESPVEKLETEIHGTTVTDAPHHQDRLTELMSAETVDLDALRKVAWGGIPSEWRPSVWKVLLCYVPSNAARRADTLNRKRNEYHEAASQHYRNASDLRDEQQQSMLKQISVDIPRTSPGQTLFHIPEVQRALERILYVWATRHPASGYVQGMNDLVTPFFYVFLSESVDVECRKDILDWTSLEHLNDASEALVNSEADTYWCLSSLLSGIQDHYTFAQPGIQRRVHYLRDLVGRVDEPLRSHLDQEGLDFLQFAFRWMNCLLMRELPFPLIVRVWDTYLAEPDGFATFHVYVCAALLVSFREELLAMEFQDLVMFLQHLPTAEWGEKEVEILLSQAYMWRSIFGAAPSHLHKQRL